MGRKLVTHSIAQDGSLCFPSRAMLLVAGGRADGVKEAVKQLLPGVRYPGFLYERPFSASAGAKMSSSERFQGKSLWVRRPLWRSFRAHSQQHFTFTREITKREKCGMMRDRLSSEERMSRFYSGEKIDRVPCITSATMYAGLWCGLTAKEFYEEPLKSYRAQKLIGRMHCCDGDPGFDFPSGALLDFGGKLEISDCEMMLPKIVRYPITSLNEAIDYVIPSVKTGAVFQKEIAFSQIAIREKPGKSVTISAGSPMTKLFNLVEPELLLRWFIKEPEVVHKLLGQIIGYLSEAADFLIETFGIEKCVASANYPGESSELISLKIFEEFAFPYILKIHDIFRKKGVKKFHAHLCGSQAKHLEYYKELPLGPRSFISVDEQTDIRLVANILGRDNIYAGNVPSAYLISKNPASVYNYSRDLIKDMKYNDGGFILMPSCDLPMDAKPQSVDAMLQAARDFGQY